VINAIDDGEPQPDTGTKSPRQHRCDAGANRLEAAVQEEDRFNAGPGIAVRQYDTDVSPADYVLLVNKLVATA